MQRHDVSEPEARPKWLNSGQREKPSRRRQSINPIDGFDRAAVAELVIS